MTAPAPARQNFSLFARFPTIRICAEGGLPGQGGRTAIQDSKFKMDAKSDADIRFNMFAREMRAMAPGAG
jgi:hypothetical protein